MERWGQYYRPAGMAAPSGATDVDEDTPVTRGGGGTFRTSFWRWRCANKSC
jgi:hypothetical protein